MNAEAERVEIASPEALWSWLEDHHKRQSGVWLVTWKAQHPDRYVGREDVLDALIAHGWIDGRRMKLDEDRTMQWIAPRQQRAWAESYKARAARLIEEGRMHPAGLAAIEAGKASGLWDHFADVDALEVPGDLAQALRTAPVAQAWFADAAPSYRRNVLRWLKGARTDATRSKRIAAIVEASERGEKIPHF